MPPAPDAAGSVPSALTRCGLARGCVPHTFSVTALNQAHMPVESGETPAFLRLDATVTHFSTYAVAIVTAYPRFAGDANCDGQVNGGDIPAFLLALTDPSAYGVAHPSCNIRNSDANVDGPVDLSDVGPFVNCILTAVCP